MIARALSSAAGGIATTTGLLFVMQLLIAAGEEIIVEQRVRHDLGLSKVRDEEDIVSTPPLPKRPDKPKLPPITKLTGSTGDPGPGIHVPLPPPTPSGEGTSITGINFGDGPLFNIIKVSPTYPKRAAARGLEGTVLLQYDVTTEGQVINVVVLESSDPIFETAAITAAYRFKYKPKTVDGIPYESKGLRNLFRFEMEE